MSGVAGRTVGNNALTANRMSTNQAGLAAIRAESGGVLRIGMYPYEVVAGIAVVAKNDVAAGALWDAVTAFAQSIHDRPATDPAQCVTCDATFDRRHPPAGLSTLCADVPDAQRYMIGGLCAACWPKPETRDLVRVAYGVAMGVETRIIDVGPAGHA